MNILTKYFPNLSDLQKSQFQQLEPLYREWNEKINVISRKDIDHLYERHVLHSLAIAKAVQFKPGTKVIDIGTGGGFPGIPLAVFFPDAEFLLVDSIGKKIKVVEEIAKALELSNIRSKHARAEEVKERFDFVVSRAVTKLNVLYGWSGKLLSQKNKNSLPNGMLSLKGGDVDAEIAALSRETIKFPVSEYFKEPFFEEKYVLYTPVY